MDVMRQMILKTERVHHPQGHFFPRLLRLQRIIHGYSRYDIRYYRTLESDDGINNLLELSNPWQRSFL